LEAWGLWNAPTPEWLCLKSLVEDANLVFAGVRCYKPPSPALSALVIEMVYYNLRFALIFDEERLQ